MALAPLLGGMFLLTAAGCSKRSSEEPGVSSENLTSSKGKGLVISQVYGGTGGEGALYNRDFVELFNKTDAPIPLADLSIHFAGSATDFVRIAKLPEDAVVAPGGYFLVGFAAGQSGADLRVDAAGAMTNILPVHGKIALVRNAPADEADEADASAIAARQRLNCGGSDAGRCTSNERIIDMVGYGMASDYEGDKPAPQAAVVKAVTRKGAGCVDTADNANDFEVVAPVPRSSRSPIHLCGGT